MSGVAVRRNLPQSERVNSSKHRFKCLASCGECVSEGLGGRRRDTQGREDVVMKQAKHTDI